MNPIRVSVFRRGKGHRYSRGLTLLEVLLVLALLVTIFGVLWQLVSLYARHYEIGEKRMARTQLVRSISQILTDDLSSAVQDPIHPQLPGDLNADAIRRFGLRGDTTSLAIDVIEPNLLSDGATVEENRSYAATGGKPQGAQVPELKTIFYEFVPMGARENTPRGSGFPRKFGLSRRELDFETPEEEGEQLIEEAAGEVIGGSQVIGSLSAPPTSSFMTAEEMPGEMPGEVPGEMLGGMSEDRAMDENQRLLSGLAAVERPLPESEPLSASQIAMEMDEGTMWVPEVVECRFRYYDGDRWFDSWNSIERAGLPAAVEVTVRLMTLRDVEELRTSSYRGEMNFDNGPMPLSQAAAALDLGDVLTRTLTITLPTTSLARHKVTERRRPTAVKKEMVQRRAEASGAARAEGSSQRQARERRATSRSERARQEVSRQDNSRQELGRTSNSRSESTREGVSRRGSERVGQVRSQTDRMTSDRAAADRPRAESGGNAEIDETKPLPIVEPPQDNEDKVRGAKGGADTGNSSQGYLPAEGETMPLSSQKSAASNQTGGQTWIRTPKK